MSLLTDDHVPSSLASGSEAQPQTVDGQHELSAPAASSSSGEGLSERYPGRTVMHVQQGLWDVYEEKNPDGGRIALAAGLRKKYSDVAECAPYIVRMFKHVLSIPGCRSQIGMYAMTEIGTSLVPALTLWYQGQLISMSTRVDSCAYVGAGRIVCTFVSILLREFRSRAQETLNSRICRRFALHCFRAYARVDVLTFARKEMQKQLLTTSNDLYGSTVIWQTLWIVTEAASRITQVGVQMFVLLNALKGLKGATVLALLTLAAETVPILSHMNLFTMESAWAVTTRSKAYLKLKAWNFRQLSRARNIAKSLLRVTWPSTRYRRNMLTPFDDGRVAFTIHALGEPSDKPEFLASLNLDALDHWASPGGKIPNMIKDGTLSFPADDAQMISDVALEFRYVSFKYPESDKYALCNVSFSLAPGGQLCVIVGSNEAGKSTILKLIVRLYDPEEGEILIGGHDIRTLKLHDLREAVSVLFQDYTHFPLSIRDNIALGEPSGRGDETHVRLAARLGGAESFVEKLSDGFDTYLERPDTDYISGPPEGSKTTLGNTFDVCAVKDAAGIKSTTTSELSGGQMQRLAVWWQCHRRIGITMRLIHILFVGLGSIALPFDEPSASLDPAAEHDPFDRLRELRGSKTMVFSSHRFGNLTRHSDLILYRLLLTPWTAAAIWTTPV
ncbi:P-loop containing nucleoside triphosphate hydrolase protein [Daedaleopsis nitida]|nr:P-loop containing nucleoside triphosphate hydrolase protein [Daedaleopsis nitida]